MAKYFLSRSNGIWGWKEGLVQIWSQQNLSWVEGYDVLPLIHFEAVDNFKEITEAEVEEITGGLPAWQNIF